LFDNPEASCRQCGAATEVVGELLSANQFAGRRTDPIGGVLLRCPKCLLVLRHPVLTDEEYDRLYSSAPAKAWSDRGHRQDHRLVAQRVTSAGAKRVLDIGCGQGGLFDLLPPEAACFAIDPLRIEQNRFTYIGSTVYDASATEYFGTFDVCTATDVIEHFPNPILVLAQMALFVRPGGLVILTTGDANSKAAKQKRGKFWYFCFAEHLSFISDEWARKNPVPTLSYIESVTFRHGATGLRMAPTLAARMVRNRKSVRVSGVPGLAVDHRLFVYKRESLTSLKQFPGDCSDVPTVNQD
jgi:SAM-dependent methyltransferase